MQQGVMGQGQQLMVQILLLATWPGYSVGLAQLEMKPGLVGCGLSFPRWLDQTCVLQSALLSALQAYPLGGVEDWVYSWASKSGSGFIQNQCQYETSTEM